MLTRSCNSPVVAGDIPGMKRITAGLAGALLVLTLTACGSDEPDLAAQAEQICREAVSDQMKDPSSTEFRDVVVEDKGATTTNYVNDDGTRDADVPGNYWRVEGEVNAKNGFGAMVGFREFQCEARKSDGREMAAGYVNVASR